MHLLVRGCGAMGVSVAMRASRAGLAVTLMAEDAFEADRLEQGLKSLTGIAIRREDQGLPEATVALAPPELLPQVPLRMVLTEPGNEAPEGAAAIYVHRSIAEIGFAKTSMADKQQILSLLEWLALPVIEAPEGASQFAGVVLIDRLAALADHLLLTGAVPWEIDEAMEAFGFETGVFAAQDIAGLDLAYTRRHATNAEPLLVTDRMVREGRLGRGAGVGWYRYPGGGGAVIDPLMEDMAVEEARFAGISQRDVADDEVIERLLLGLACCGAELLERGEVADEARFDRLCHLVLGYPDNGIGVLGWARKLGWEKLSARLMRLQTDSATLWPPQSLLKLLA